jgi:hypothetical protein
MPATRVLGPVLLDGCVCTPFSSVVIDRFDQVVYKTFVFFSLEILLFVKVGGSDTG